MQPFQGNLFTKHITGSFLHGRYTCLARNPKCSECGIQTACKFYNNK
ncbi:MAG: hypothetical protein V9E88_02875 [Ferruginibacter sp.]